MVNKPLIRPLFLGGGTWPGGGCLTSHDGRKRTFFFYIMAPGQPFCCIPSLIRYILTSETRPYEWSGLMKKRLVSLKFLTPTYFFFIAPGRGLAMKEAPEGIEFCWWIRDLPSSLYIWGATPSCGSQVPGKFCWDDSTPGFQIYRELGDKGNDKIRVVRVCAQKNLVGFWCAQFLLVETQRIQVWYIYLHLVDFMVNVGK